MTRIHAQMALTLVIWFLMAKQLTRAALQSLSRPTETSSEIVDRFSMLLLFAKRRYIKEKWRVRFACCATVVSINHQAKCKTLNPMKDILKDERP